jgi:3-oxoacyl-[acyl-carrier protein] reductase
VDVVNDRLDGKVALISGGARGIGRRIAATLAEAGARVLLTSRSAEAAEAAAREIREGGNDAAGITLDVADHEGVESTVRGLLDDYGTIPVLVNNAGATRDCLLLRMKKEEWDFVLETNLTGLYHLCRAVVPSMVRARYGRIVNITSVVAQAGNPGQVNYAASKAGIEGFTRSLARELASRGITVNCVAPGFIDTEMTRSLGEAARESLLEKIPMQRSGRSEEVAEAVRFLATPEAGYITGTTLNVNGGMYM